MRVTLIGNYVLDEQESMLRFGRLLVEGLAGEDIDIRLVQPRPILGRMARRGSRLRKWLAYVDKYILFYPVAKRAGVTADVVHICDQGNAMYTSWFKEHARTLTCHDMLAVQSALGHTSANPTSTSGRILQRWILRGIKHSHVIICDSRKTESDVARFTGLAQDRLVTIPIPLNYPYSPIEPAVARECVESLGISRVYPYLLHVGGNQWYKNRMAVIRIFEALVSRPAFSSYHLVLAGKEWTTEMREYVSRHGLGSVVHQVVNVTNQQLASLYSMADALIFPSLSEGFGWPVIEAQACGCPVFASKREPMTDIGGTAARYFDPEDVFGAAAIIADEWPNAHVMRQEGIANVRRFDASAIMKQYREVWKAAFEATPGAGCSRSS